MTTESLHGFARQRVLDLTGGKQKPPLDVGSELVLLEGVAVAPHAMRSVRIKLPAGYTGPVRLLDGTLTLVDSWSAREDDRVRLLTPSLYQVELDGQQLPAGGMFRVTAGEDEFVVQL